MLNLTIDEIRVLAKLVYDKRLADGEELAAQTPLNAIFQKLYDEAYAQQQATEKAAEANALEAARQAENDALLAAYPAKAGKLINVKIGMRTYPARVMSVAAGRPRYSKDDHSRYLHLEILRKDGQLNVQMNGGKYGNGWYGWVSPESITPS